MNLNKIKAKTLFTGFTLVMSSITCSSCKLIEEKQAEDKISYDELVNDYKVVEFIAFDKHSFHIVKKKNIENNCYGYYDILYDNCIIKIDEEACTIIGKGPIDNIIEHNVGSYLEKYNVVCDGYTVDDLGYIIDWVREDYDEKVLVKERD